MKLPEGWILRVSRSKGKVFYYNTHTQQTQWTRPTEAVTRPQTTADDERQTKKRKRAQGSTPEEKLPTEVISERRAAIVRCMKVGASSGDGKAFTPWEHQVDAVDKLLEDLGNPIEGRASRFLLQHSTGSGKTVTIAAVTHQLLDFHDARGRRFHTVVLLIDRIKLDEQVGDSVERFLRRNGVECIYRATSIDHLASLLTGQDMCSESTPRQRVIITTIQKIGLLAKNAVLLTRLVHGNTNTSNVGDDVFSRLAVITDEAHRSHTAATRQTIEAVMNAGDERGDNTVTFVGFTATPNAEALRLFGSRSRNGEDVLEPFHCYTMARAVTDARIMDVLQNYTSVQCELELSIPAEVQEQLVETNTMRIVMDSASDDIDVLKGKSMYMMKDFEEVRTAWRQAKCMVVARSRRDVVRYHALMTTFVQKKQLPWRVFAVFSGSVTIEASCSNDSDSSCTVTEQTLNAKYLTLGSSDIVIVCDKLDTGYSDPQLACMYVDRYLRSSVQTVQLFSRLNRLHSDKRSVRIVDFANHVAQIRRHFAAFWREAKIGGDDTDLTLTDWRMALSMIRSMMDMNGSNPAVVEEKTQMLICSLDRDAFQQLLDTVRVGTSVFGNEKRRSLDEASEGTTPHFSYHQLNSMKNTLEQAISPREGSTLFADDVIRKMKTRIKRYKITFTGHVSPDDIGVHCSSTDSVI